MVWDCLDGKKGYVQGVVLHLRSLPVNVKLVSLQREGERALRNLTSILKYTPTLEIGVSVFLPQL